MNEIRLERWRRPSSFISHLQDGQDPHNERWFVFMKRNRDSSVLEETNFDVALSMLGGESDRVVVVRERHCFFGWVEWIAIHESAAEAISKAHEVISRLEDYPIIDEDEYWQRISEKADEIWEMESLSSRVECCRALGVSIFSARRRRPPSGYADLVGLE